MGGGDEDRCKKKQPSNLSDFRCPRPPPQWIMQLVRILIVLCASHPFVRLNSGGFA